MIDRIEQKIRQRIGFLEQHIYRTIGEIPIEIARIGDDPFVFRPLLPGTPWGGDREYALLRGSFRVPAGDAPLFVRIDLGGMDVPPAAIAPEGLVWIDGDFAGAIDREHAEVGLPAAPPSAERVLRIEAYAAHGYPGLHISTPLAPYRPPVFGGARILARDDLAWHLYFDARTLVSLAAASPADSRRREKAILAVDRAFDRIDWQEPSAESFREARAILAPLLAARNGSDAPEIVLVGHAHIDLAWLWTMTESKHKVPRTFATQLRLMEEYPEYRFAASQAQAYAWVEKSHPEIFQAVREAIRAGTWEPIGGTWVESDANLIGVESMVRQFLYGKAYFREKLGADPRIAWLPDTFGFHANLPQIFAGCGAIGFVTSKLSWNDTNPFPFHAFRWRGIDGTEIVAHFIAGTYNGFTDPESLIGTWRETKQKALHDRRIFPVGFGDGGGGVTRAILEFARRSADLEGVPKARFGTAAEVIDDLARRKDELPVWAGELYMEGHRGTYTSQGAVKRGNRRAEALLRDAEILETLAGGGNVEALWKEVLLRQFHDILPGSSIRPVYEEAVPALEAVAEEAEARIERAAARLAGENGDRSIAVWNSLAYPCGGRISIPWADPAPVRVRDGDGADIPCEVREGRLVIAPADVPPVGYRVLSIEAGESELPNPIVAAPDRLENGLLAARFDDRGQVVSLVDLRNRREIIPRGETGNALVLAEDISILWEAWDIDAYYRTKERRADAPAEVEVIEGGPAAGRIRFARPIGKRSRIVQDVVLVAGSRRLEFRTWVDWQEEQTLLKVAFPIDVIAHEATFEIPGGWIARANHENTDFERARFEVPGGAWADLSEAGYGVALLNDSKHGYDVRGNRLRLTLLRSPRHPDPEADRGEHRFTYAIAPHAGTLVESRVFREAREMEHPLRAYPAPAASGSASRRSFLSIDHTHVHLYALKSREKGDGWVARLGEVRGGRASAALRIARQVRAARAADLLETPGEALAVESDPSGGSTIPLAFRPFELRTVLLEF
ncbi:MAG: alpha-mannosidase [Planctomycetes bacterium]|nr:alpha-mannosidase [Planctomycetota bacterium]